MDGAFRNDPDVGQSHSNVRMWAVSGPHLASAWEWFDKWGHHQMCAIVMDLPELENVGSIW